jgi:hypothetical protein
LGNLKRDLMISQRNEKDDIVVIAVNLNQKDVTIVQNVRDVF